MGYSTARWSSITFLIPTSIAFLSSSSLVLLLFSSSMILSLEWGTQFETAFVFHFDAINDDSFLIETAQGILDYIHSDLWGPTRTKSHKEKWYFMTMIILLFFCYIKAFKTVINWKLDVENQTSRKVKRLRTDNGLEYLSTNFLSFWEDQGIIILYLHRVSIDVCQRTDPVPVLVRTCQLISGTTCFFSSTLLLMYKLRTQALHLYIEVGRQLARVVRPALASLWSIS